MNSNALLQTDADLGRTNNRFTARLRRGVTRAGAGIVFLWKYFLGVLLCQSLIGSVMIVGWTYRLMQRCALKYWWKRSRLPGEGGRFEEFVARSHLTSPHAGWPNWVVAAGAWGQIRVRAPEGPAAQLRAALRVAANSLGKNLKLGLQGIFNTWVLTMPGCVLWLFAWYDGWNNSFNKGYEQAAVGPLTGVLGVLCFITAMLYVPMAQARQAATGHWRSFYQFRLVWSLVRRRWLACLGLATLYSLLSLPVMLLKTLPEFFPQMNRSLVGIEGVRAMEILKSYFFWCGLLVFPAYVFSKIAAARIYASAVLAGTRRGSVPEELLGDIEWQALHQLDLFELKTQPARHVLIRLMTWTGSRVGKITVGALLGLVWFTFVAQIFISEFLNYHPGIGWLNQPLVQLPWFHYLPPHLK
jgi:hypothetical protein